MARGERNPVVIEAKKLVRLWDEIYSPDHKDTGYEDVRLETAIERLRKALDGLRGQSDEM